MYVTVETGLGTLRGQQKMSQFFSHKTYFSFQGIPYAKPPLGLLRFKDPEEPEPWSGVRDALKEGNDCLQIHLFKNVPVGSEDCLYLNVYTPQLDCNAGLPAMVWVHGGGFLTGSGSTEFYGPDYLIEHEVIIVTINYRLSVLGFLCLDHEEVPGNAGLKDQVMAFRWVQNNIDKFGGDPNRVTIFGESAGGASISYQIVSPLSQGLFQHAIVMSGSAFSPWALSDRAAVTDRGFRLGRAIRCDNTDTNKLLEFLRDVPASDLITVNSNFMLQDGILGSIIPGFVPCIEVPATTHSFLPASPRELMKQEKYAKVPTMIGSTSAEGILGFAVFDLSSEDSITKVYEVMQKFILQDMGLLVDSAKAKQISKEFTQFYFGDTSATTEKIDSFFKLYGDVLIDYGMDELLRIMTEAKKAIPIYAYEVTHCLSHSFIKLLMQAMKSEMNFKGVCHAEDLSVLFTNTLEGMKNPSTEEEEFIYKVTKMWTTFAMRGDPNYSEMETKWEKTNKNNFCHFDIGREFKLVPERVKQERMNLWQQLYDKVVCSSKS